MKSYFEEKNLSEKATREWDPMVTISHRGNINGPNVDMENSPAYVIEALREGYDVEIDVWYLNKKWYLGHDDPQYEIKIDFLKNEKFWCHAKNMDALFEMSKHPDIHYFWHQNDDVTLTSKGYLWTFPGKKLCDRSVSVLPEIDYNDLEKCYGICSDFIESFRK